MREPSFTGGNPLKLIIQGKSMTMESELSIRNLIFFRI